MRKKRRVGELLLEICEKLGVDEWGDVRAKKILCWDYYKVVKNEIKDKELKRRIYRQIYHLEKIKCFDKNGLTTKGRIRFLKEKNSKILHGKSWDRRWRIVIFDIPEKKKKLRNNFRNYLKELGFQMLQNSIWISPLVKLKDVQNLVRALKISKYVIFILAEKISNDLLIEKKFNIE